MKKLEFLGVFWAAAGFTFLSFGSLLSGFILGLLSCFCLIAYFKYNKMLGLLGLQIYFLLANIIGIFNNF